MHQFKGEIKLKNEDIVIDILQKRIGELEMDKAFAIAKIVNLEEELKKLKEVIDNKKTIERR